MSYLFYLPAGIDTTAASIFAKLAVHFSEHGVMWLKCKTVSIDGARAMVRIRNGVVALIKQVTPEVVSRAGLSKCGARLEALLRGTTQWSAQKFLNRASSDNVRNRLKERGPKGRHNAREFCGRHRRIQGIFKRGTRNKFIRMCIDCIAVKTQLLG